MASQQAVLALPYGDLDVAAVLRHHGERTYRQATELSATTLEELGLSGDPVVAPPGGLLPSVAVERLPAETRLLLSERAQIDTKPQLEIFADDVKCTHGATVGRLDELSAFYMKSRGVSAATTRSLLTYAFAAEVLETIEQADVKDALEALTLERYAGQQAVGAR